ncbi:hypothetical protein MMC11_001380 [Xylographa trunciseda]|nr:hypothetical protein [Xylographa trunciseda]
MSSDLWAAFTQDSRDPSVNPWSQSSADTPAAPKESNLSHNFSSTIADSFQQPQIAKTRRLQKSYTPLATTESWPESMDQHENVWEDTQSDDFSGSPWIRPQATIPETSHSTSILVADLEASKPEDDDFGDFEEAEVVPHGTLLASSHFQATAFPTIFTNTAENNSNSLELFRTPQDGKDADVHHDPWAGVESLGKPMLPTPKTENIKPVLEAGKGESTTGRRSRLVETSVDVPYEAEEWGEFSPDPRDAVQPSIAEVSSHNGSRFATTKISQSTPPRKGRTTKDDTQKKTAKTIYAIPPTNVPPPSILLSFLSNLIVALPAHITQLKCQISISGSSPAAVSDAQVRSLLAFRVAARIITGRKLRWKRDVHLSQSMKIGPASAGRSSGMKLTGVDKAEVHREDREAAEIVRVWKANLGSIRAALAASNGQARTQPLILPDISEQMLLRTATIADGAITATKCCFLCGLKRDERIVSLDGELSDSLGEWWAEHWGHVECQSFWEQYEQLLRKRS